MDLTATLNHAVTRFDRRQADKAAKSKRHHYNPYALGIYLGRVDDIAADVAAGHTVEDAICRNFTSDLQRFVLDFIRAAT